MITQSRIAVVSPLCHHADGFRRFRSPQRGSEGRRPCTRLPPGDVGDSPPTAPMSRLRSFGWFRFMRLPCPASSSILGLPRAAVDHALTRCRPRRPAFGRGPAQAGCMGPTRETGTLISSPSWTARVGRPGGRGGKPPFSLRGPHTVDTALRQNLATHLRVRGALSGRLCVRDPSTGARL